jgi:hypothetical protein
MPFVVLKFSCVTTMFPASCMTSLHLACAEECGWPPLLSLICYMDMVEMSLCYSDRIILSTARRIMQARSCGMAWKGSGNAPTV